MIWINYNIATHLEKIRHYLVKKDVLHEIEIPHIGIKPRKTMPIHWEIYEKKF